MLFLTSAQKSFSSCLNSGDVLSFSASVKVPGFVAVPGNPIVLTATALLSLSEKNTSNTKSN